MSVSNKLFLALLILLPAAVFGQAARTPFSTFGIGEHYGNALIQNQGMAGVGVSQPQYWFANNQNPALLVFNYYTVFQAGTVGESRTVKSSTASQKGFNGNLNYLVTAFPLQRGKWANSIGLMPYTSVNFKLAYQQEIANSDSTMQVTEAGSGGFSQLYWAHGVRINKDFSVGLKATYIFGSELTDYSNYLINSAQVIQYIVGIKDQTYVKDFQFTGGLSYSRDSVLNGDYRFSLGLTYSFATKLRAERNVVIQRRDASGTAITADTLKTFRGSLNIPSTFTFGASISKGTKWSAGAEFTYENWSNFTSLNPEEEGLAKAWKAAIGGEITPDPLGKFFKRITYRVGASTEKYPFLVQSPENPAKYNQLTDFGINFGLSVPTGRSSLDFGFRMGKRGNVKETVLEETYWKVYFGITFNDQWFIRRKFD